ncbi:alpha/beta hydrolase [Catellatospora citrea]|uniref:alpha/beta hydrolase n=1 Tax=Catellatospora citrea TaxID=53366 RepID=UPI0033E758A2
MKMVSIDSGRGSWLAALTAVAIAVTGLGGAPVQAAGSGLRGWPSRSDGGGPIPAGADCVKPTVVLVHGAFADASSWSGEVERLQNAGYVARAVANPLRGLTGDAASVADFLKTLSGPIVLVGHSYGGSVISNAAAGIDAVKQLVYVDASAPAVGETSAQTSGQTSVLNADPDTLFDAVPYPNAPEGDADLYLLEDVFVESFAPDLPEQLVDVLWASQRPATRTAFSTPSAQAAWMTIPSWYVIGGDDKIITPESQMAMAKRAKSQVKVVPGGSHLTLISHPDAVTDQILAAARAVCAGN